VIDPGTRQQRPMSPHAVPVTANPKPPAGPAVLLGSLGDLPVLIGMVDARAGDDHVDHEVEVVELDRDGPTLPLHAARERVLSTSATWSRILPGLRLASAFAGRAKTSTSLIRVIETCRL
jgi:hypothetical protein